MRRTAPRTLRIRAMGLPELTTTSEHPFYVRRLRRVWDNASPPDFGYVTGTEVFVTGGQHLY